jgi:hypothetical protein
MKAKITRGAGFKGLADYLTDGRGEIIGGTCSGETAQELAVELRQVSSLRPEVARPVWHSSLSLPAGEHLSDEKWREVADDYLTGLGFDTSQTAYTIVKHSDTEHEHIHIAASRVQLDSSLYLGQNENLKAADLTQELEKKHGLTRTPDRHQYQEICREGYGDKPVKKQLQAEIGGILKDKDTTSREVFEKRLTEAGIEFKRSTGGYSFSRDSEAFKGSQLGKSFTATSINAAIERNAIDQTFSAPAPVVVPDPIIQRERVSEPVAPVFEPVVFDVPTDSQQGTQPDQLPALSEQPEPVAYALVDSPTPAVVFAPEPVTTNTTDTSVTVVEPAPVLQPEPESPAVEIHQPVAQVQPDPTPVPVQVQVQRSSAELFDELHAYKQQHHALTDDDRIAHKNAYMQSITRERDTFIQKQQTPHNDAVIKHNEVGKENGWPSKRPEFLQSSAEKKWRATSVELTERTETLKTQKADIDTRYQLTERTYYRTDLPTFNRAGTINEIYKVQDAKAEKDPQYLALREKAGQVLSREIAEKEQKKAPERSRGRGMDIDH